MQSRRVFLAAAAVPLLRGQIDNTRMFADAEAYERFMGRWSRLVAPLLLNFASIRPGGQVLDVGSGTVRSPSRLRSATPPPAWSAARPAIQYELSIAAQHAEWVDH